MNLSTAEMMLQICSSALREFQCELYASAPLSAPAATCAIAVSPRELRDAPFAILLDHVERPAGQIAQTVRQIGIIAARPKRRS